MKTRRWIGLGAVAVAAYGLMTVDAWSADAAASASPPDKTVSADSGTKNSKDGAAANSGGNSKADSAATKPAPSKAQSTPKSDDDKNGDFKPSEEISEDMAVAYPSDI